MESSQGMVVYVRTKDKVLLRFADPETVKSWIRKNRLSLDDEYLAADQTWQPLSRLLQLDSVKEETAVERVREVSRDEVTAQEEKLAREGPRLISAAGPSRVETPAMSAADLWRTRRSHESGADIWGSEPDLSPVKKGALVKKIILPILATVIVGGGGIIALVVMKSGRQEQQHETLVQQRGGVPDVKLESAVEPALQSRDVDEGRMPEVEEDTYGQPENRDAREATLADSIITSEASLKGPTVETKPVKMVVAQKSDEFSYEQHMREGMKWLAKNPQKALSHFQAASRLRPWSPEPMVKEAECEVRLGRYRDGLALYQRVLDQHPDYGPAIVGIARAYVRMGDNQNAKMFYLRYLEVHPYGSHAPEARAFVGR